MLQLSTAHCYKKTKHVREYCNYVKCTNTSIVLYEINTKW